MTVHRLEQTAAREVAQRSDGNQANAEAAGESQSKAGVEHKQASTMSAIHQRNRSSKLTDELVHVLELVTGVFELEIVAKRHQQLIRPIHARAILVAIWVHDAAANMR